MAVVAVTSARGAPGVTTSALAMALAWPRPCLLVEADVAGSSSVGAGYLRGWVPPDRGLVDLALAHRRGVLADAVHDTSVPLPDSTVRFIAGLTSPAQVTTVQGLWEPIAAALRGLARTGTDVIVDAGRLGAAGGPVALLRRADLVLLATRTTLPAIAATRARLGPLREDLTTHGTGDDALALLLVGEGQPYTARKISAFLGVEVAASLAWDPVTAEVFSLGSTPSRRFPHSRLLRSVTSATSAVDAQLTRRRNRLTPATTVQDHADA